MFQRSITSSRFTLSVVSTFACLIWLAHVLFAASPLAAPSVHSLDLTPWFQTGSTWSMLLALLACGISVYLSAELNDAFILLRVTSRTISSCFFLLLATSPLLACASSLHVVLLCCILFFFPLFASYQRPDRSNMALLAAMTLSVASCIHPPLAWLLPLLWIELMMLRAFSLRMLLATIFGLIMPWWLLLTAAYCTDRLPDLLTHAASALEWARPDYAAFTPGQLITLVLSLLLILIGGIDYLINQHLDKTRTRAFYNVLLVHTASALCWLAVRPADADVLLPAISFSAAAFGGHFAALSHGRVQNIICIVLVLLLAAASVSTLLL